MLLNHHNPFFVFFVIPLFINHCVCTDCKALIRPDGVLSGERRKAGMSRWRGENLSVRLAASSGGVLCEAHFKQEDNLAVVGMCIIYNLLLLLPYSTLASIRPLRRQWQRHQQTWRNSSSLSCSRRLRGQQADRCGPLPRTSNPCEAPLNSCCRTHFADNNSKMKLLRRIDLDESSSAFHCCAYKLIKPEAFYLALYSLSIFLLIIKWMNFIMAFSSV